MDIGPPGSSIPLRSEVLCLYTAFISEGELPPVSKLIEALVDTTPGCKVKTIRDIYFAHLFVSRYQDCGDLLQRLIRGDENELDFLWEHVYAKLASATGRENRASRLAQRIMKDAKNRGLLSKNHYGTLVMGVDMAELFQDLRREYRTAYRGPHVRVGFVEGKVRELREAQRQQKKAAFVKFGLALVPATGPTIAHCSEVASLSPLGTSIVSEFAAICVCVLS